MTSNIISHVTLFKRIWEISYCNMEGWGSHFTKYTTLKLRLYWRRFRWLIDTTLPTNYDLQPISQPSLYPQYTLLSYKLPHFPFILPGVIIRMINFALFCSSAFFICIISIWQAPFMPIITCGYKHYLAIDNFAWVRRSLGMSVINPCFMSTPVARFQFSYSVPFNFLCFF